jgi:hypothetical protein
VDITSNTIHKFTATFRTQICRKSLRIQLNGFSPVQTLVDITSNIFYKCTATSRTQICRKSLRIQLNGFSPVQTLVDITSNTFHKCTATFRTQICRKCLRMKMGSALYRRWWTSLPTTFISAQLLPERSVLIYIYLFVISWVICVTKICRLLCFILKTRNY